MNQARIAVKENGTEKSNFLDGVRILAHSNTVTDIVRMLDEQENDRGEDFREGWANEPTETKDESSRSSDKCDNLGF